MIGLTPRQLELLRFIRGYQLAHGGVAPTLAECAQGVGLRAKSGAHRLVCGLEERGVLRRLPNRERSIEALVPVSVPSIDGAPLYVVPLIGVRSVRFSGERL